MFKNITIWHKKKLREKCKVCKRAKCIFHIKFKFERRFPK